MIDEIGPIAGAFVANMGDTFASSYMVIEILPSLAVGSWRGATWRES